MLFRSWRSNPISPFYGEPDENKVLAIQKDFSGSGRRFYCPGIMFWKRTQIGIEVLEKVSKYHLTQLEFDSLLPDDKAINQWLSMEENSKHLIELDERSYIIGHRLLQLMAGSAGYKLERFTAFHANYVKGLPKKVRNMKFASIPEKSFFKRVRAIIELAMEKMG